MRLNDFALVLFFWAMLNVGWSAGMAYVYNPQGQADKKERAKQTGWSAVPWVIWLVWMIQTVKEGLA